MSCNYEHKSPPIRAIGYALFFRSSRVGKVRYYVWLFVFLLLEVVNVIIMLFSFFGKLGLVVEPIKSKFS